MVFLGRINRLDCCGWGFRGGNEIGRLNREWVKGGGKVFLSNMMNINYIDIYVIYGNLLVIIY